MYNSKNYIKYGINYCLKYHSSIYKIGFRIKSFDSVH